MKDKMTTIGHILILPKCRTYTERVQKPLFLMDEGRPCRKALNCADETRFSSAGREDCCGGLSIEMFCARRGFNEVVYSTSAT